MSGTLGIRPEVVTASKTVVIRNDTGLRIGLALAVAAESLKFSSDIVLKAGTASSSCKSLLGLVSLCAPTGSHVTLIATGMDAPEAIRAIVPLFCSGFAATESSASIAPARADVHAADSPQPGERSMKAKSPPKAMAAASAVQVISPEQRRELIQNAAYLIAEKNGFQGDPTEHWAIAEAQVAAQLQNQGTGVG